MQPIRMGRLHTKRLPRKKVLIMEDEANIRSFVVINLKRAGYETIEAGDGEEALEQIRKNPRRLVDRFSPITYAFYIFHIATFRFWEAVLLLWEPYASLSVYLRYPIFMVGSFLLSLMLGVWFTKMFSVFRLSKKNA